MLYECHITLDAADADKVIKLLELAIDGKWKTSKIDGDPVLGQKVYFYLTTHDNHYSRLKSKMSATVWILQKFGVDTIRQKIEAILHDTKVGVDCWVEENPKDDGTITVRRNQN